MVGSNSCFGNNTNFLFNAVLAKPLCKREQIRDGRWIERKNFYMVSSSLGGYVPGFEWGHKSEQCAKHVILVDSKDANVTADHGNKEGSEAALFDRYEWQLNDNDTCDFQNEFNPALFCELMQNAAIFFLGDSLVFEQYVSLVSLLGGNVTENLKLRSQYKKLTIVQNVCADRNTTLMYRWSRHLTGIDEFLNETFPTVLVLSSLAHYNTDSLQAVFPDNMDKTLDYVKKWQQDCRKQNLTCPFFWRTTSPGHHNCGNFTKPENNISIMEDYIASHSNNHKSYMWGKFHINNDIMLKKLESSGLDNYNVIDGYDLAIRRPDNHFNPKIDDCLHHCTPGVAHTYSLIFLHHLRTNRTRENISKLSRYNYSWNRSSNILSSGRDVDWNDHAPYLNLIS